MKTTTKTLPTWHITFQISILSFLGILLILPHVEAEATVPTTLPTSVEGFENPLPNTPSSDQLFDQGRESARQLLPNNLPNIPRTLNEALNSNNTTALRDSASAQATSDLSERLAGLGATNLNATELARGDISSLAGQIPDPQRLAETAAAIQATYQDLMNQRQFASIHALWATGIQAPTDCSSGNDDGKDLCSAIEELKQTITEVKAEVEAAKRVADQIKIYVTNKPAFLNTPSILTPVCLGLLVDGPGADFTMPTIAPDSEAYNASALLVSQEAVKAKLLQSNTSAGTTATTNTSDPLSAALGSSDTGARRYSSQIDTMQANYDEMYLKSWQNLKTTMDGRFKLTETRADEAEKFTNIIQQTLTALLLHPPTP